jgi:hypothetical protein
MNREPTEIEPAPPRPCPHCGGGPDTVLVRRRVTTYEYHRADCPSLGGDHDHHHAGHDHRDHDL